MCRRHEYYTTISLSTFTEYYTLLENKHCDNDEGTCVKNGIKD